MPPPLATTFHQPKSYVAAALAQPDSPWFANSGASHHVTAEHSNLVQHNDSTQGPEQLYVGNEKGVTKVMLLKGNTKGGLYFFNNLVVLNRRVLPTLLLYLLKFLVVYPLFLLAILV
ncbi:hypothetical protein PIB30_081169 [Stylosanthes scabra]|uniref:Uncharacterized protein n=1 Tax=Stylosanthes scabra TaxID=79078 RepID=A0ABU6WPW6_9FABA|nr:hypothetical protein [Stylosanthes scabra]